MNQISTISTHRLLGRPLSDDDYDDLFAMHQDPRVMATLGGLRSADQTRELIAAAGAHWKEHGFGLWSFRDRDHDGFVGRGGLRRLQIEGHDEVEIAYAVCAARWRGGFATEMSQAALDVAFEHLSLESVVAFTLPTNQGSQRVMQKLGFGYERDIRHANLPHVLYRCRAEDRQR